MIYKLTKIKITKLISISCLLFLFSTFAYAQTTTNEKTTTEKKSSSSAKKEFSLKIEPFLSIKNGNLGEYVFLDEPQKSSDSGKTPDNKLSHLNWQIKNEIFIGTKFTAEFKHLFAQIKLTSAIPQSSGIISDSDWKNIMSPTLSEHQAYKTNYSESDNYINYDYSFSISGGWNFNPISTLKINPNLELEYSKIKFTAKGGWKSYGKLATDSNGNSFYYPWNDENTTHIDKGNMPSNAIVLEYMRETTSFWMGLDIGYIFNSKLTFKKDLALNFGFKIAPYIYTFNQDDHPYRATKHFTDICEGFFKTFKISQDFSYFFTKDFALNLNITYSKLFTISGVTYSSNDKKTWSKSNDSQGGASASTFEISFGCKYNFLQF
ncbi:omptin family outer membrane protease [Treponema pectinovorum]|uniref:omptin family outer membrane protease n=1 Tax=Treponema pectinovorum TaxID=164 RepID=UPI0011C81729|nr:omptin family outer membrane protease [Treponema pectinovorum]